MPLADELIAGEDGAAVGEAVNGGRRREVRAVDVVEVGRIDLDHAAVAACEVRPRVGGGGLAPGAVVLGAVPDPGSGATPEARSSGWPGSSVNCEICSPLAVQVLPVGGRQGIGRVWPPAAVIREPDAAVVADQDVRRVAGVERESVEVRVLVPAQVSPGRAAVVGAEDPA